MSTGHKAVVPGNASQPLLVHYGKSVHTEGRVSSLWGTGS